MTEPVGGVPEQEAVTQEDKTNASIVQGLVLGGGLLGFIPGLNFIGWLCGIAVIVLYFVWKDKSAFVRHHTKQALGLQIVLLAFGILLAIVAAIAAAAAMSALMRGSLGGAGVIGGLAGLLGIIGIVLNLGVAVLGLLGLLAAQKGEAYTYPVVGNFINNFGQKKA